MNLPNYITLTRIFITPFFFTSLISYETGKEYYRYIALGLFIFAALTDALDGFLARVFKQKSELGKVLDPVADKLLLLSGYLGLIWVNDLPMHPPRWITATIVFRDLMIIGGLMLLLFLSKKIDIRPNWIGKITTALQMVTLLCILLSLKAAEPLWFMTAFFTIISGVVYGRRGIQVVLRGGHQ